MATYSQFSFSFNTFSAANSVGIGWKELDLSEDNVVAGEFKAGKS